MSYYKKTLRKIAYFQTHHPYSTILVLTVLTIFIAGGLSSVKTVASLEKMMPEDMEEIKYFNVLRDNFLGKDMIGIVIGVDMESQNEKGIFDIRDKRVFEYIEYLKNLIDEEDSIIDTFIHKFMLPVKHEGIVLGIANIATNPTTVRPGDDFVEITTYIENSGLKSAKSIEAKLSIPNGLEHSYSDNNRKWVGKLSPNESKQISFFVNIDENANSKRYDMDLTLNYEDVDNNKGTKKVSIPLLVKERPNIEVIDVKGTGLAGSKINLEVTLKNTGTEDAEAIDARIIKQSSQPFSFDLRSNYVGELQVGETGKAVFAINIDKDAEQKEHNLKLLIRAKGDTDKGDNNIYTFNRRAIVKVDGKKVNPIVGMVVGVQSNGANKTIGIGIVLAIVVLGLVIHRIYKRKK